MSPAVPATESPATVPVGDRQVFRLEGDVHDVELSGDAGRGSSWIFGDVFFFSSLSRVGFLLFQISFPHIFISICL